VTRAPGLILLALIGAVASAAGSADEARAQALAVVCAGCHGTGAQGPGAIPSLDDLTAAEIVQKLSAYSSGELQGTLMNRLARGYTAEEIRLLADALGRPAP
jgi:sulfide dehydrogenase cytochrome subunit